MMRIPTFVVRTLLLSLLLMPAASFGTEATAWTARELRILRSLSIDSLKPIPPDPSNHVADDPRAAALGERLFFDVRLSDNAAVACATCHQPDRYFTDGLPLSQGIGETRRGAPSLVGTAYSPWLYWDGRRDSHWTQALVPLETPEEHGFDRRRVLAVIADDEALRQAYEEVFGPLPGETADDEMIDRAFSNVGKAIAAYERTILPTPSRFDAYVRTLLDGADDPDHRSAVLSTDEIAGLKLFISDAAQCLRCHNGPLFTNFSFHNIGLIEGKRGVREYDFGRVDGVRQAIADPFRCEGPYSDAEPSACVEEQFVRVKGKDLIAAFKVPTLRNVAETAPYMHDGRFSTLRKVLQHYNEAPSFRIGFQQLNPLDLAPLELDQIAAFLRTLTGPLWASGP
ncbi:MAG: cytochrome-c peroxidase [Geminicoccaceae bacterium]